MARGEANLHARVELSTTGASRAKRFANLFTKGQREAQNRIFVGINNAGWAGVEALKRHAPVSKFSHQKGHRPGTLRDAITVLSDNRAGRSARRPTVVIGVDNEKAVTAGTITTPAFPYVEITRRGRRAFSVKTARRATSHERPTARALTEDGRETGQRLGRAAALAFPGPNGKLIYRRAVGRYTPASDWVLNAEPEVKTAAQAEMDQAARDIARFLRTGFARSVRVRRV